MTAPGLRLADSPTGNLDAGTSGQIAALFRELAEEKSVMLIVVTHDLGLAAQFARTLELRDGILHPHR